MSKYETADYQDAVGKMVSREVIYCVSTLISELAKDEKHMEDLMPILARDDYESAAKEHEWKKNRNGDIKRKSAFEWLSADSWQEACDLDGIEPYTDEALEHWIVSGWLADKLEAKGEMVLRDFMGLTIWGRTCSGQAICMDSVICAIYDELHAGDKKQERAVS